MIVTAKQKHVNGFIQKLFFDLVRITQHVQQNKRIFLTIWLQLRPNLLFFQIDFRQSRFHTFFSPVVTI